MNFVVAYQFYYIMRKAPMNAEKDHIVSAKICIIQIKSFTNPSLYKEIIKFIWENNVVTQPVASVMLLLSRRSVEDCNS